MISLREESSLGQTLGITSVILGAVTFGIQLIGGLCCGWIGWPLGIAAVICGLIALGHKEYALGAAGILLSVIGFFMQLGIIGAGMVGLGRGLR